MLGMLEISLQLQSSVRAYVSGESQWSKGQKEATYFLNAYARTKSETDYQKYHRAIAIPLGDHKARVSLDRPDPDIEAARQGFLEGMNHPDDVPGMISIFLHFRHTPLMKNPIAIWGEADVHLFKLSSLGQQLHELIRKNDTDEEALSNLVEEINSVSLRLTPLENEFSRVLGEVSRLVNLLIVVFVSLITVLLLGLGIVLSRRMIKQRVDSTNALRQSEMRLKATISTAMDAVVEISSESVITHWSSQAEIMFGWTADEAIGQPVHRLIIPPDQREAHLQGLSRFMATGVGAVMNKRVEVQALRRDGSEFPAELTISPIRWQDKYEFCAFIRDVSEQKNAAEQLRTLAHYDAITGLPNRILFQDRLSQETKQSNRTGLPVAVMFLDVDHFKDINDTLGHNKGDILLKQTADRLLGCIRETDTVARFGGDEFVVILSQLSDLGTVDHIAERMLQTMANPFHLAEDVAYLSASIGIAIYPVDADTHEELIKNADQAMYLVKKTGRNRFTYFTSAMQESAQFRMRLANDMRSALVNQHFRVCYQPIVHLATGDICKAEALVRWQHPEHGLISPASFIPIAEETGMIAEIGDWVFRAAAQQVAQWRARYCEDFQISVNKSPVQFQENGKGLVAWCKQLQQMGLSGESIVVEITEGMLMEANEATKKKLLEYRDFGIQVALDDFGTGYSSLSYLNKFDIDYIKIDQSFVKNLAPGSDELVLCEAIIAMAHKLGMTVIAEGVETDLQKSLLTEIGCDHAQGYLFSKPLPPDEFETLFEADISKVTPVAP